MAVEGLVYERQDGVATFTFDRPEARNALTSAMFLELERRLLEIATDPEVRVVVLTGAGGAFSAGADLKPASKDERRRTEAIAFPGDTGGDILDRGNRCSLRIRELARPVIASIPGDCVGIACSLALAADLRIASDTARLGVVFSKRGLGPDGGASALLRELVGPAKALELLFTGDLIDAEEALRLGLVNRVVASDELTGVTHEWAQRLAKGPTLAYAAAKEAVRESATRSFESLLDLEARNQRTVSRSDDVKEGIRSFLEKRKPEFRGR